MKFKKGVELHNSVATMDLELIDIMAKAERGYDCFRRNRIEPIPEFTITSIVDGIHMTDSFHYRDGRGRAFDFRTWCSSSGEQLIFSEKEALVELVKRYVPHYVDVIIERDHIHVEIDKDE
jgi:hypothetical protein